MLNRIRIRPAPIATIVCAVAAIVPASASASIRTAELCDEPVAQVFSQFGDDNWYALAPGGDFEDKSLAGWTLSGGAAQVDGSESYDVTGTAGSHSLLVPENAQVTSANTCVDPTRDTFRFFVRAPQGKARVRVDVLFVRSGEKRTILSSVGWVNASSGWQPTPILRNGPARALSGVVPGSVRYRFTADNGAVQIDDLHIDPRRMRKD